MSFSDILEKLPPPHEPLQLAIDNVPRWSQMLESAPALAVIVAYCDEFDGGPKETRLERMREYVLWKRRKICSTLGWGDSDGVVQFLARVRPELCSLYTLLCFQNSFSRDPDYVKFLQDFHVSDLEARMFSQVDAEVAGEDVETLKYFLRLPQSLQRRLSGLYIEAVCASAEGEFEAVAHLPVATLSDFQSAKARQCGRALARRFRAQLDFRLAHPRE